MLPFTILAVHVYYIYVNFYRKNCRKLYIELKKETEIVFKNIFCMFCLRLKSENNIFLIHSLILSRHFDESQNFNPLVKQKP